MPNSISRPRSVNGDQSDSRELLARLENIFALQLQYAAENKLDAVAGLTAEADGLLARLCGVDISADPSLDEAVKRVVRLHRRLILTLAMQKQDAAGRLRHLHRGKTSLHVYKTSH